eukprot:GFYU01016316.1.p1 GENE.GFYU01016316.1~~GFYU01016316.1.p1  ORF type:complete len:113 (-),score=11.84 GFYU01016316.1:138-476(-)
MARLLSIVILIISLVAVSAFEIREKSKHGAMTESETGAEARTSGWGWSCYFRQGSRQDGYCFKLKHCSAPCLFYKDWSRWHKEDRMTKVSSCDAEGYGQVIRCPSIFDIWFG